MPVPAGQRHREPGWRGGRRSDGACCPNGPGRSATAQYGAPFEGTDVRVVDGAVVRLQQARRRQLSEQDDVQPGPKTGFGPVPQAAPGRDAGAAHHLTRHIAPCHASAQNVEDACQRSAVGCPASTRVTMAPLRAWGQQGSHAGPQVVGHKIIVQTRKRVRRTQLRWAFHPAFWRAASSASADSEEQTPESAIRRAVSASFPAAAVAARSRLAGRPARQ